MATIDLQIDKSFFLPVYYPYLFDYSYRYNVYYGGRASGKTFFLIQKLLIKGLMEPRSILLMQKQTNKVKDSVWKELLSAIDAFKLTDYFTFNKSEFRAICVNGTEFRCVGLDEPEKIKGYSAVSDVYLDEVTAFTLDDLMLIDGTIRSPKYNLPLQIYCSFNPISKQNWVFKYFGFDTGIVPENTFILKTTYLDNPRIDESFHKYMNLLKVRDPQRYKIEALGDFVSLDKLVFPQYKVEDFDYKEIKGELLIGMDFGFTNDPTTLVCSMLDETNKRLYIFQEWGATGKTNKEIAEVIKSLGLSKSVIIADCAEPKSIEELRRNDIQRVRPSVKGKDSILFGIQKIKQYEIIVSPACEGIITEFENYTWKKDKQTGEYVNTPIDQFNHYIDALRYSLQCASVDKLKTYDKALFGL